MSEICQAIATHKLVEFDYRGLHRIVAPYCHGTNSASAEVFRGIQVGGESRSGGFGFGKLWFIGAMSSLRVTNIDFDPSDPKYNPNDSAMRAIHCRIEMIPTDRSSPRA
jgi:hypothetical protein